MKKKHLMSKNYDVVRYSYDELRNEEYVVIKVWSGGVVKQQKIYLE
jgi:hypothetical protein